MLLTTALGRKRKVDETALLPFEVSKEEAREWLMQQTGDVFGRAREAVSAAFEDALPKARANQGPVDQVTADEPVADHAAEWTALLQRLAERYGQPGDDMATAAGNGARSLFVDLASVVRDAASIDATVQQRGEERARTLEDLLDELGIPTQGLVTGLVSKIEGLLQELVENEDLAHRANRLEQMAATIEANAASAAERLRLAAAELRRRNRGEDAN